MAAMVDMLYHQVIVKLNVAIFTPVAGMFFKKARHKIIENHYKPYAKRNLAKYNQPHFKYVPLARFQQRYPQYYIAEYDNNGTNYSPGEIPPPAVNGDMITLAFWTM